MAAPRNSYRAWALAAIVTSLAGLAAIGVGFATGDAPLLVVAYAAVFGAGLVPSILDWRHAKSLVREARKAQAPAVEIMAGRDIAPETVAAGLIWIEPQRQRLH